MTTPASDPRGVRLTRAVLLLAILVLLALKLRLVPVVNVNWDEFRFLSRIHELERGELATAFQTFHVRLFSWLPGVAVNEVDQVIAGRMVAFVLRVGSCVLLFLIGRRLYGTTGALFAVLASLGFSHLMRHGEAFRADPIVAFLFILAASLLILRPSADWAAVGAGVALAMAGLVSVKAAMYLPTIGIILAATVPAEGRLAIGGRRMVLSGAVALGLFLVLYGFHAFALPGDTLRTIVDTLDFAADANQRLILGIPKYSAFTESLQRDRTFWLLVMMGASFAFTEVLYAPKEVRRSGSIVLGCLLPLATLLVYRNTYSYYYAMIIPPAALACGLVASRIEAWMMHNPLAACTTVVCLALPLGVGGGQGYGKLKHDTVTPQRKVLEAVRQMFPHPVPYLDRCSMIAAFPKIGPFMSTLVLSRYRAAGKPILPSLFAVRPPVFVLANVTGLNLAASWDELNTSHHRLLRDDFEYLKASYIHHWGPIWVAGVEVAAMLNADTEFELAVTGRYTIEATNTVLLDGSPRRANDAVQLSAGRHVLRATERAGVVALRYGDHLPRPGQAPPEALLFIGLDYRDLPLQPGRR